MKKRTPLQPHKESLLTELIPRTDLTTSDLTANQEVDKSRRHFVAVNLLGLALGPVIGFSLTEDARAGRSGRIDADDTPAMLDPDDPQAQALHYTVQSTKDGQSCSNCALYTGSKEEEFGPCAIFSYRVSPQGSQLMVSRIGWCSGWNARQPV